MENNRQALEEIQELVDEFFIFLTRLGVFGLIKKISLSVGSPELDQTYMDVLGNLPDTNAVLLVDLAIRLDHFPGVPEGRIRELDKRIRENTITHQILTGLVVDHFTFFEVDYKIRQRIGALLQFKSSSSPILELGPKLLKTAEKDFDK